MAEANRVARLLIITQQCQLKIGIGGFGLCHAVIDGLGLLGLAVLHILVGHNNPAVLVLREFVAQILHFTESLLGFPQVHQQAELFNRKLWSLPLKHFYAIQHTEGILRAAQRLV